MAGKSFVTITYPFLFLFAYPFNNQVVIIPLEWKTEESKTAGFQRVLI
jgi:hypothetical protein